LAFFGLKVKVQPSQLGEDIMDLFLMLGEMLGFSLMGKLLHVDDTIIHVPRECSSFNFWLKLGIDHSLEGGR
jgi:hypothetical protein